MVARAGLNEGRIGIGIDLWMHWTLAHAIGGFIGWIASIVLAIGTLGIGLWLWPWPVIVAISVGVAEASLLARHYRRWDSGKWAATTTVSSMIAFAIGVSQSRGIVYSAEPRYLGTTIAGFALGGAVYGMMQWVFLLMKNKRAAMWPLVTSLGWGIGTFVGLQAGERIVVPLSSCWECDRLFIGFDHLLYLCLAGTVGTFVFGAVTGVGLAWILGDSSKGTT
jgi:hypothetical protein